MSLLLIYAMTLMEPDIIPNEAVAKWHVVL